MRRIQGRSLPFAVGAIILGYLAGVFGLKMHRSELSLEGARVQFRRVQDSAMEARQAQEARRARVNSAIGAGRMHPRMPVDQLKGQLDQMVASLNCMAHPQNGPVVPQAAQASDAGVLVFDYRAVLTCDAARLAGVLEGLAQARPGLLVTALAMEPGPVAAPGTLKLTLDGVALLEP